MGEIKGKGVHEGAAGTEKRGRIWDVGSRRGLWAVSQAGRALRESWGECHQQWPMELVRQESGSWVAGGAKLADMDEGLDGDPAERISSQGIGRGVGGGWRRLGEWGTWLQTGGTGEDWEGLGNTWGDRYRLGTGWRGAGSRHGEPGQARAGVVRRQLRCWEHSPTGRAGGCSGLGRLGGGGVPQGSEAPAERPVLAVPSGAV